MKLAKILSFLSLFSIYFCSGVTKTKKNYSPKEFNQIHQILEKNRNIEQYDFFEIIYQKDSLKKIPPVISEDLANNIIKKLVEKIKLNKNQKVLLNKKFLKALNKGLFFVINLFSNNTSFMGGAFHTIKGDWIIGGIYRGKIKIEEVKIKIN